VLRSKKQLAASTETLQTLVKMKNLLILGYGLAAILVFFIDRLAPSDASAIALALMLVCALPVYVAIYRERRVELLSRLRFWWKRRG
jgi:hypothetical protein